MARRILVGMHSLPDSPLDCYRRVGLSAYAGLSSHERLKSANVIN
jgi:hypothetical protein